jgi:predicted house-cleaning noncanonical NTP pyrophosphatase (MazG superfamily)
MSGGGMKYHKLVRDRIPEIIVDRGDRPVTRVLDAEAYDRALRDKLQEEVAEFIESGEVAELVDVLEVVYALATVQGVDHSQIEDMRRQKLNDRGGFEKRVFLEEIIPGAA